MTFLHATTWAFVSLVVGTGFGFWFGWTRALHPGKTEVIARKLIAKLRGN